MNRKVMLMILTSLLAAALAGCDLEAGPQTQPVETQPVETQPEVTAAPTETPPRETDPPGDETPEGTVSPTEELPEVTTPPTEEPPEVTVPPTEEPAPTADPTETPEVTAQPTATPAPTATPKPTATPAPTPTPKPTATPAPTPTPKPTATPAPTATPKPTATPAPTPAPKPTATPAPTNPPASTSNVPYPSAPGTSVEQNDNAIIDYSNAKDGYVMIKWTGDNVSIAVQVKGPNNAEKYTYYLRTDGSYNILPLSDGNGKYTIDVLKSVGTKYAKALSASITVKLTDSLAPFLRPNQFVNYTAASETVKKAQELTRGASDTLSKVKAVYSWVVSNMSYDYDKAKTVQGGYVPDLDQILQVKKGICYDYASLMSAMLRSQGVPVKMVFGYTSTGEYHAWINVWSEESGWMDSVIFFDGKSWKLMDPTFASTGNQSASIMDYIGNPANYKERFTY